MKNILANEIYKTIAYFDILDMPVTSVQIWRYLAREDNANKGYSLAEIKACLGSSTFLKTKTESKWGYYSLKGRLYLIPLRLQRYTAAAQKWKITRRVARLLMYMPFTRMIAGSGSLSLYNTGPDSDLDLFIIARKERIWTTRLFLLLAAQLTGRRRKYWNRRAADKICLNHYLTDDNLRINPEIQSIYTATLYWSLVPLYGQDVYFRFQKENSVWMKKYLYLPFYNSPPARYRLFAGRIGSFLKWQIEEFLMEPVGGTIEALAESWQRRVIERHARLNRAKAGRVVLSKGELAFHPDTKAPSIVDEFAKLSRI